MKTDRWLALVLLVEIIFILTAPVFAEEWGKVMYARPNTLIRDKRTIDTTVIRGSLKGGEAVKADFLKDGWYAIFDLAEKQRNESRARGYVHASRLLDRPSLLAEKSPGSQKPEEACLTKNREQSELPKELSDSNKPAQSMGPYVKDEGNNAVEVKDIKFKLGANGEEFLYIEFDRFYTPAISAVQGKNPKIILDINNLASFNRDWTAIKTNGNLIRIIRASMDTKKHTCRIVLDMDPAKDYSVQPVFAEMDNTYVLKVSDDNQKP